MYLWAVGSSTDTVVLLQHPIHRESVNSGLDWNELEWWNDLLLFRKAYSYYHTRIHGGQAGIDSTYGQQGLCSPTLFIQKHKSKMHKQLKLISPRLSAVLHFIIAKG